MPVDWSKYPDCWAALSLNIRNKRAKGRCEWRYPNGARCAALNGQPHPVTGSKVVLTVAHLDHDTKNNLLCNLMAMCQLHHNRYDIDFRVANRKRKHQAHVKAYYEQHKLAY